MDRAGGRGSRRSGGTGSGVLRNQGQAASMPLNFFFRIDSVPRPVQIAKRARPCRDAVTAIAVGQQEAHMKKWIVFAAALLLAACGGDSGGWVPGLDLPPEPPATRPAPAPAPPRTSSADTREDAYCHGVAHQRMLDGKAYGYDRDTLKAIYNGAYRDCMAWRTPVPR